MSEEPLTLSRPPSPPTAPVRKPPPPPPLEIRPILPVPKDGSPAALYVRISTKKSKSRQHEQTVESQIHRGKDMAAKRGWVLTDERIYVDEEGGGNLTRNAFIEMLKEARDGRFKKLIFMSVDRFSRGGIEETFVLLSWLKTKCGVEWFSILEPDMDEEDLAHEAKRAKREREKVSIWTKDALARKRAAGVRLGRPPGRKDSDKRRPYKTKDRIKTPWELIQRVEGE